MEAKQVLAFANRFFQAYNDVDFNTIGELVSEDMQWEQHNHFKGQGKEQFLDLVRKYSETAPGRRFTQPTRWAVNGDTIFIEHQWKGTPVVDVAAFNWKAGEPLALDSCSLLVFKAGKIVEFSDYA